MSDLQMQNRFLIQQLEAHKQAIIKLEAEKARLTKALMHLEYIDISDFFLSPELIAEMPTHSLCPNCGWKEPDGHASYCVVGKALERS